LRPGERDPASREHRGGSAHTGPLARVFALLALVGSGLLLAPPSADAQLTGTIEGTVTLGGTSIPEPTVVSNSTDPEICGTEHSLRDLVVSADNRGVRHTIVSLTGLGDDQVPSHEPERLVIDNRDCQFVPHALVATIGDTIVAENSDPTLHNTHYYGPMRSNVALARQGMAVPRPTRRLGLVTVLCDVHGWMKAFIRIDRHHLHDVTDEAGSFEITGVPPGAYELEFWHERLGERTVPVRVRASRVSTVETVFLPPRD